MIRATAPKIGIRKAEPLSFWAAGVLFFVFLLIFASFPGGKRRDVFVFNIIPYIMENVNDLLSGELLSGYLFFVQED